MNSPCYISLDQHTCTPSPLLIPLSLRMYMCKNTYTQQFMKHTVFSTSIYTCVSISLHPKAPGDSCECTAQIWAHTHRATRLPCTAMLLPSLRGDLDDFKPPFLSSGPYTIQKWILFLPVLVPHDLAKLVAFQWCSLVTPEPWTIPAVTQRPQSQNTRLK